MTKTRRILTGVAFALSLAGLASADTISFQTSIDPVATDVTNLQKAITPFVAGTNGIALNAVLQSFTIYFNMTDAGTVKATNSSTSSSSTITATLNSTGYIYLFNPVPSIDPNNPPTDDVFGGNGPAGSVTKKFFSVAPGATTSAVAYSAASSATSGVISDASSLASVQSPFNVYVSTLTSTLVGATNGNGSASYSNQVSGVVGVTYNYYIPSTTPEPTTMALFGSALVGLGFIRKRKNS